VRGRAQKRTVGEGTPRINQPVFHESRAAFDRALGGRGERDCPGVRGLSLVERGEKKEVGPNLDGWGGKGENGLPRTAKLGGKEKGKSTLPIILR